MRCAALTLVFAATIGHAAAGDRMPDRQSRPVSQWLVLLREDNPQDARARAAYNLGFIRPVPTEAIPLLVAVLSDRSVSGYAAMSLSQFGRPARPALTKVLYGPDHEAGLLAAMALGWMREDALPELTRALGAPEEEVRRRAVEGFFRAGNDGMPGLVRALSDPAVAVRMRAAEKTFPLFAAKANTVHPAVAALRQLCSDEAVREAAALALRRITGELNACGTP
jgi:HEAT repeat protein